MDNLQILSVNKCKVEGCDDKYRCKGYCGRHYSQFLYHERGYGQRRTNKRVKKRKPIDIIKICSIAFVKAGKYYSMIDAIDIDLVNSTRWFLNNEGYVYCKKNGEYITMHNVIIGKPNKGFVIDHKNRDKLDNRRSNLRFATYSQNCTNSTHRKRLLPRGVYKDRNKYQCCLNYGKKRYYLGNFDTPFEAGMAFDKKMLQLDKEFAVLNFPCMLQH